MTVEIDGFQIHLYWVCGGLFFTFLLCLLAFLESLATRAEEHRDDL